MQDSRSPHDIHTFNQLQNEWWDHKGHLSSLHEFNPIRLRFIKESVLRHYNRPSHSHPFEGLSVLDIGCGGGLLSEPLTRLGAEVTGIDAAEGSIKAATEHGKLSELKIDYRCMTAEELLLEQKQYDVVIASEIIEHVQDAESFLDTCSQLLRPNGLLILSTLNRTLKSRFLAILMAEYVFHLVPRGTHDWDRFLKPSEINAFLRAKGVSVKQIQGLKYIPWLKEWEYTSSLDMNYILYATF